MNREGKKCVLYPRVSTEMQVDGYSLEGQKNSLKRFADREEMEIVGIYEDAGKDMYDIYYDGIIKDAYDTEDYDVWSDASSDIYEFQSDLRSEVYDHDDERVQKKMDKFKKSILRMKEGVND